MFRDLETGLPGTLCTEDALQGDEKGKPRTKTCRSGDARILCTTAKGGSSPVLSGRRGTAAGEQCSGSWLRSDAGNRAAEGTST